MALPLSQLPSEVLREIKAHRWLTFFIFTLVSAAVLVVAFVFPYKYRSEVIVYVDHSGITAPLMEGVAEMAKIGDVVSNAREMMASFNALEPIARNERLFGPGAAEADEDTIVARVEQLRQNFSVRGRGESYLSIRYQDEEADKAFIGAQLMGQSFIERITTRKRQESRGAFAFIDGQVESYEAQLETAEERLKSFLSENTEGTEAEVTSKIASVRSRRELAGLELQELKAREQSLQDQLGGVGQNISREVSQDRITQRIISLQSQLDSLRLRYHDTYPDIISLESQIAELERRRASGETGGPISPRDQTASANPLYQELKAELVKVTANIQQVETRISALGDLLEEEMERMKKIQANKAQLADLTRNMEVNRSIYNDLLRRRERARLSVNLDSEAQGVTYQIQEDARYPTSPSGLQFKQFASVGLLLGLLAPFGLIAGLLQVDPRVRSKNVLEADYGIPVLGEIPPVVTPYERRRRRGSYWVLGFAVASVVVAYIAIVVLHFTGVIG
jgi:polysaccharide chain length determinant protein (PEP-CTERM system associated)